MFDFAEDIKNIKVPAKASRVLLKQPIRTEEGIEIKELIIPPFFKLSHIENLSMGSPSETVVQILDSVLGIPEAYSRQLSLEDAGVLLRVFSQRLMAMQKGFGSLDDEVESESSEQKGEEDDDSV